MARNINKKKRCSRGHRNPASRKKSRSHTHGQRNYSLYINRVLKEVVPHSGISSHTLDIMNTMINGIFERISTEACNLMHYRKRRTLTPEDFQKAVYLLLPGKLAKYAVAFANEAVQRYVSS
ncbi:histone H2B subacrosomal variant-like [Hippopotamus amphibius kiboko]|uniref:histone H2B subacrosomal variant-like n=1 Tax=Hippopotamus amphibius kiboko TaxID=575201 RepID=UPI002594A55C|nr:histone H2B subacrosomal variant-like [Hippopotamus amphibius kiboko]